MEQIIHIKNMVCPRCKTAVQNILEELNISHNYLELGELRLKNPLTQSKKEELRLKLNDVGFEILESERLMIVSQIKILIMEQVRFSSKEMKVNFSDYLASHTNHNYNYLSRLFSEVEGKTIEKFITAQKIEKIKELLFNNEQTLSEIAFSMDYSSSAYLSTQFKKETGITPSEFKKSKRHNLDIL
jgi:AraC-like DNA-binding protein